MTDMFLIMLRNPGFKDDTYKLMHRVIHDYLNTDHCQEKVRDLVINEALRNEPVVLQGLYNLLVKYLTEDNYTE